MSTSPEAGTHTSAALLDVAAAGEHVIVGDNDYIESVYGCHQSV